MLSDDGRVLLKTNGPDPKTGVTTIDFTVEERGRTRLFVADVLGDLALALIDDEMDPGTYQVRVESHQLSSGMYMCVLQTPKQSYGRMILVER